MPKATTELGTEQGVKTAVHTEDGDGTFHITKEQDVQATLDYTKYLREHISFKSMITLLCVMIY